MSYFVVDYENVNSPVDFFGVNFLLPQDTFTVFYSSHCPMIRHDIVQRIVSSGCEFNTVKLKNGGKNALDMYIASYIAELMSGSKGDIQIAILSKDKGYYAITDYWAQKCSKKSCNIIQTQSLMDAFDRLSGTVDLVRQIRIGEQHLKNISAKIEKFRKTGSPRITLEKAYNIYTNTARLAAAG